MPSTIQLLSELQKRIHAGDAVKISELRDATWQAMRFLVFSVSSGEPDQLGSLSGVITQATEPYFGNVDRDEDTSREWARSLAVVGQIAVALYESMAPSAEARKMMGRSQHAKNVARILLNRGSVQARELRQLADIPHQPTLARIIHSLASARIVAVERGAGNTAWYRLTPEGRHMLRAAILEPAEVRIPMFETCPPTEAEPAKRFKELVHELAILVQIDDGPKIPAKSIELEEEDALIHQSS
jgi:hypothetical protein